MRRGLFGLALLAAACAHAPPAPAPLDQAAALMAGRFDSAAQAAVDPAYLAISLQLRPIWPERVDGRWFYVEQAMLDAPRRPYRQRVYRLTADANGGVVSDVFLLEEAARFVHGWENGALAALADADLQPRPGCSVYLRPVAGGFRGATRGEGCESRLRGARWASAEVELHAGGLRSWDRGYDAAGRQVWGAAAGPYDFRRREP